MMLEFNDASFEGQRGTGKTTAIHNIQNALGPEYTLGYNRTIVQESDNPFDIEIKALHSEWESLFLTDSEHEFVVTTKEPEKAEELVWQKFDLGLWQIVREIPALDDFLTTGDLLIRDRDLDTFVAYTVTELTLSNPAVYNHPKWRKQLIRDIWQRVLKLREVPPVTFYLTTANPEIALERSYSSHDGTALAYELTPLQSASQRLADEVFTEVINMSREYFPDRRIFEISVDGKKPEEVASAIYRVLTQHPILTLEDTPLSLWGNSESDIPLDLKTLIQMIHNMTGAAFPTESEVSGLGFSNCVFSNHALSVYGNSLELGNLELASVLTDAYTGTCPVHWVALQREGDRSRIVDTTPFYPNPMVGEWGASRSDGAHLSINHDKTVPHNKRVAEQVRVNQGDFPLHMIYFAERCSSTNDKALVIAEGRQLLERAEDEGQEVFISIRLIRLHQEIGDREETLRILESLSEKYPNNLVVLREVARLSLEDFDIEGHETLLDRGIHTLTEARRRYLEDIAHYFRYGDLQTTSFLREQANAFFNYYKWIFEARGQDPLVIRNEDIYPDC